MVLIPLPGRQCPRQPELPALAPQSLLWCTGDVPSSSPFSTLECLHSSTGGSALLSSRSSACSRPIEGIGELLDLSAYSLEGPLQARALVSILGPWLTGYPVDHLRIAGEEDGLDREDIEQERRGEITPDHDHIHRHPELILGEASQLRFRRDSI
jgi:hypothetical protein